jgi:type II secretory pathway pseudopilin PulG
MSDSHDPWEAARERQREEVKRIFAERQSAPVSDRRREFRLSRRNSAIVLAVIAVIGLAAVIVVPNLRSDAAGERATEAAKQRRLVAAERARIIREQRPHFAAGPPRRAGEGALAHRRRLLGAGRAIITRDARARVAAGTIDGPVQGTQCTPFPTTDGRRAQERDPAIVANRYECVAFERKFPLSELEGKARTGVIGAPYWLVVHYRTARLAYCKIQPRAGEGGRTLAFVRVERPCADPLLRG